ncbi:N-acetyltransferase domain-containing protein [Favolaschia claudopus]|uniref:N-acetyltransferase domain-containing protein n=1 Tax=Favolaschia claudopus TaxID=2862362 RepID=A0AAW0EHB5_9AGAR
MRKKGRRSAAIRMTLTDPALLAEEKILVVQHSTAVDFLGIAYPTLRLHESSANILLAHALARAPTEFVLTECQFINTTEVQLPPSSSPPLPASNFWLTVWSEHAKSAPVLDMALSCIESSTGKYPLFMWTRPAVDMRSSQWLNTRVGRVTAHLHGCVPLERVFAVFGPTALVTSFAKAWAELTHFKINPEPLYKAFLASCASQELTTSVPAAHCGARKATMKDVEAAGKLCQQFANGSAYPLSLADATAEAQQLINKGQLWVGIFNGVIASICAVTRSSLHVSTITKVFTAPEARRNGVAQTLVGEVTRRLFDSGKHSVVLYVACDNSAQRVYERVGFRMQTTDVWLELGFVGTHPGHW